MGRGFKPSDQRRVQAACDKVVPYPYEAHVTLDAAGLQVSVEITDPDIGLPVANASFDYQMTKKPQAQQPPDLEIARVAGDLAAAVVAWPGVLAAQLEARHG